jgi:hypothetical protein
MKGPSDEEVKAVIRQIPTPQLRRAFFEGLKNPLWVKALAKEGMFRNPPEPENAGEGLAPDVYWPEIEYLTRMAALAPEDVVDVVLTFGKSNNAWVRRGVFAVGAVIPPVQAARLEPLIRQWKSTGIGWRTDPRDLVAFALNLLRGEQNTNFAKWFANLIFEPSRAEANGRPKAILEDFWYEQGLHELVEIIGSEGLSLVLSWLVAFEYASDRRGKDYDYTYLSRESIKTRDHDREDVENGLIDAVRDLAVGAMLVAPSAAKNALLDCNMLLGRKVAMCSLRDAIRQVDSDDANLQGLLAVAQELLFADESSHYSCRIDYAELARAVASLSPETLEDLLPQYIERRSQAEADLLRSRRGGVGANVAGESDSFVDEYSEYWSHAWLSSIGLDTLPAQLRTKLAELDSKYGVIEAPLEPTPTVAEWIGPNSPLGEDEMAVMSAEELVAHLESWHDLGDGWGPEPSHEGQARTLTALLAKNPSALAGASDIARRLRPIYLRSILSGWEAALHSNVLLPWTQVTELIVDVLGHACESRFPPEGGRGDDDADFRYAKQTAVSLLQVLVKPNTTLSIPEDSLSRFAELTIGLANGDEAWNEYITETDNGGMDALTTSLNWQWPIRIRALIYLMSHGRDASWHIASRTALEDELSRADSRGASRAVVGQGVGRLLSADSEWLTARIPELFGSESGLTAAQQIALTTATSSYHYHSGLYDLLSAPMIGAIRSDQPILAGWRTQFDPLQRIGEWIITAIAFAHDTVDGANAQAFFSTVAPKIRGDALGHIAWSFMHAQNVDDPIRDRVADLWDSRVSHVRLYPSDQEELAGFYWFVKSGRFSVEWWLPRLQEAMELCPQLTSECHVIAKEIALAADVDPRSALDVLKQVLDGRDETGIVSFELTRSAVPIVIARAVASGDHGLEQDAFAYMNELGEKGNLTLETEVNRVLMGGQRESSADG